MSLSLSINQSTAQPTRKHVLNACEDEDAERVKTILDNVYAVEEGA